MKLEGFLQRRSVFLVHATRPLVRAADARRAGQPHHRQPASREIELLRAKVPFPQSIVRAFCSESEAFFVSLEYALGLRTHGDVLPQHGDAAGHRNDSDLDRAWIFKAEGKVPNCFRGLRAVRFPDDFRQFGLLERPNRSRERPADRSFAGTLQNAFRRVLPLLDAPSMVET